MTAQDTSGFDELMGEAALAGERGDFDAAAKGFAEAAALAPDRIEPLLGAAMVTLKQGDIAGAESAFRAITAREDATPAAYVGLAHTLEQAGRAADALVVYEQAAERWADAPDRWADLAAALAERDRLEAAADAIAKALAIDPAFGPAVANAARIHLARDDGAAALGVGEAATAVRPDEPEGWKALAAAKLALGDADGCLVAFERAIRLNPQDIEALIGRGYARERRGDTKGAAEDYAAACAAPAPPALVWFRRGALAARLGRVDEARSALSRALRLDPADPLGASLMLARLGGETPARAPAAYARAAFDAMAPHFDAHLAALNYDAPQRLVAACAEAGLLDAPGPDAIDLGCGTGLIGAELAGRARRLSGVDLSPRMVERTGGRGGYDALAVGDAVAALAQGEYDLALAADFLIYIGDLAPVFAAAAQGLRTGGAFAATLELAETGVEVRESGRFAHGEDHARAAAEAHGFTLEVTTPFSLREEDGATLPGLLFIARRS